MMYKTRRYLVFLFVMVFIAVLFFRLFCLQIIECEKFTRMASDQHNKVLEIKPQRGVIYDFDMEPLAVNLEVPSVYCNPRTITDKKRTSSILSRILRMDKSVLAEKFSKQKAFIWIKRKIDEKLAKKIKKQKLTGVDFLTENKREYAGDAMAAHVIGFVGVDNNGLEGIELEFDEKLRGKAGYRHLIKDAKSETVLFVDKDSIPAENGFNIVLTIDSVIQYIAEEELSKRARKYKAEGAVAIVMNPASGRILALANYPGYDLNDFENERPEVFKNKAISNVYEPGSVFKIITASAVINEGLVDLDDKFYCERGKYRVSGRVLHDFHKYGELTFREVIGKSSNIGTVKAAKKLGGKKLYNYIKRFGFGEKTSVSLPGEVSGISRSFSAWSRSDITTIPIGQGIAVTPIQLAAAISTIANGGYLVKPYIVDKITTWEGGVYRQFKPTVRRRVLKEETCVKMREILKYAVTAGTGRRAASDLYQMAGKTGTAQKVNPDGGYFSDKYDATFIGIAPADAPVLSIVVAVFNPRPVYFGGVVAAPAFKKMAERILQYMDSKDSPDVS